MIQLAVSLSQRGIAAHDNRALEVRARSRVLLLQQHTGSHGQFS